VIENKVTRLVLTNDNLISPAQPIQPTLSLGYCKHKIVSCN